MSSCTHQPDPSADILIRGIPTGLHAALANRARHRHQSLETYLKVELFRLAEGRSLADLLDPADHRLAARRRNVFDPALDVIR